MAQHVANPGGELAREVARLAGRQAADRGRRFDGDGGPEAKPEGDRVEQQRPLDTQAEDQRGGHRRANHHRQPLYRLGHLDGLVLARLGNNILDQRELGWKEELRATGEQEDIGIDDAEQPAGRDVGAADVWQRDTQHRHDQQRRQHGLDRRHRDHRLAFIPAVHEDARDRANYDLRDRRRQDRPAHRQWRPGLVSARCRWRSRG